MVENGSEELHSNVSERIPEKAQFALAEIQNLLEQRGQVGLLFGIHVDEVGGEDLAESLERPHVSLLSLALGAEDEFVGVHLDFS